MIYSDLNLTCTGADSCTGVCMNISHNHCIIKKLDGNSPGISFGRSWDFDDLD